MTAKELAKLLLKNPTATILVSKIKVDFCDRVSTFHVELKPNDIAFNEDGNKIIIGEDAWID